MLNWDFYVIRGEKCEDQQAQKTDLITTDLVGLLSSRGSKIMQRKKSKTERLLAVFNP